MPVQNSPPAIQTRSQARDQAVLPPTPTASLGDLRSSSTEGPFGHRTSHGRGSTIHPGRTTFKGPGEDDTQQEEKFVEEEESDITEAASTPVGHFKVLDDQL
ncbi:hypothetical protein O181_054437 [Austropuccinia psidii MF-1]|uniref:Uncharacterized protein n=1 Tax=Austropuccinia psidii MF-1 TaxID=1389203 RepID=A0A9Q3HSI7_9BASI|nr:hypothetical protein [Austropuccinia psidii MF-1]